MGLYCSSSELPAHSARFCRRRRDRRYGKRCGGLLADGSAGGRDVGCCAHFGAAGRAGAADRSAPLVAQLQTQSEQTSVFASRRQRADAAGAIRPQGAAGVVHTGASSAAGAASTTQRPPIAAALVEAPRIIMTTEAPPVRVFASEPNTAAVPEAAPVAAAAAAPTPAPRTVIKKPRAVARAAAPPRYDVPRYAAPRYEPRYDSMQRGPYAFLRQYGSYGQEY